MKKPSKFLAVLLSAMTFVSIAGGVVASAVGMPEGNPGSNTGGDPGNNPGENPLPEDWENRLMGAIHDPDFIRAGAELAGRVLARMRARFFIEGLEFAYGVYRHHHYVDNFFLGHGGTVHITRRMLEESRGRNIRQLDEGVNDLRNRIATVIPVGVERPRNETQDQLRALFLFLSLYAERRMYGEYLTVSDDYLINILSVLDFDQLDELDINGIRIRYMNGCMRVIGYNGHERIFEVTIGEPYER